MLTKVIHIATIIKTEDLMITNGTTTYPQNKTYNNQNHSVRKNSSNFQNVQQPNNKSPYKNIDNKTNYNNESLLLNDVYGKESFTNSDNKSSNDYSEKQNSSSTNENMDFSSLFNNFFQSNSNPSSNTSENSSMPDIETMLKFKKIFEHLNSKSNEKDPLVNLLYAIKPFMQESKKNIIDQLAKFMTISYILQDFNTFL